MPILTRMTEQKRRPNRRNIHLDGRFAFGVNLNVVAQFHLKEGMELTDQQVLDIQRGEVRQECMDKALRFLERRLYSRHELHTRLTRGEYGPAVIEEVLNDLQRLGYVDDERFARTKALSAAQHKHHGKRRAMLELIKSGVDRTTADRALETVYEVHDSMATARQLAKKKAPSLRRLDPLAARRRLAGMLLRRGFDYETVRPVIDEVLGDEPADDSGDQSA
ncbi:MAG: RecX family transcriptional regulator [Phycisphaerales bacterium]|jgi:regulatory protein|nr:RecX family transcriptional regulator [Phycisphaerales bacterium]